LKEIEVSGAEVSASLVMPSEQISSDIPEFEDDTFDRLDYRYDAGLEAFHDSLSADMLGVSCQPVMADFAFGLATPGLDSVLPWSASGYPSCHPQAPPTKHSLSAPNMLYSTEFY